MSLVKWFRKNNKKVMAVVVIVLMFGFIGGSSLTYLSQRSTGEHRTVAYFLQNKKITSRQLMIAQQDLEILKMLRADRLLQNQPLTGIFLGELLFSEQRISPALINHIRHTIGTSGYRISEKQIADIYRRPMQGNVYWLLLTTEARLAGIRVSTEDVGRLLARMAPQLFDGVTYTQIMRTLITRNAVSEDRILETFARLLAVLQYANLICSAEDTTAAQIVHAATRENQTIDVEFVKFDSAIFAKDQPQPKDSRMLEHFGKYRTFLAGDVTEQNPYGFGYRLPDRIRLQYLALKLEDVTPTVTPPTAEETEEYYQRNRDLFTDYESSDPNDPNAQPVKRTKTYPEVAAEISEKMLNERIDARADRILQDAKTLTEGPLADMNDASPDLTPEQFAQMEANYQTAAESLGKQYKVKLYAGRTGLLSAFDIQNDEQLANMYVKGYADYPVRLAKVLFAVDQIQASHLGPFDAPKPRIYQSIGPLRDSRPQTQIDISDRIMAIVRVVAAEKSVEPESLELTFSTQTLTFDPNAAKPDENIYSVKEKVTEDLKRLAAMETAGAEARRFIEQAEKDGWEDTLQEFNQLYTSRDKEDPNDPNDPNAFKIDSSTGLRRISKAVLEMLAAQSKGNPTAPMLINEFETNRIFADRLYALATPDANNLDALPTVMEFKPAMSFYCIKDLSVRPFWKEDFDRAKNMQLYRQDDVQSQSMAPVFLNPENIVKRLNFRPAKKRKEKTPEQNDKAT